MQIKVRINITASIIANLVFLLFRKKVVS